MAATPRPPVLLYDADCRVCRFTARTLVRLDRAGVLRLLPLRDEAAGPLLASVPAGERYATWRLVAGDGSSVGYGRGGAEVLRTVGYERAGRLAALVPGDVLDALYRVVARHRGRLGRLVPDGPAPRRYP